MTVKGTEVQKFLTHLKRNLQALDKLVDGQKDSLDDVNTIIARMKTILLDLKTRVQNKMSGANKTAVLGFADIYCDCLNQLLDESDPDGEITRFDSFDMRLVFTMPKMDNTRELVVGSFIALLEITLDTISVNLRRANMANKHMKAEIDNSLSLLQDLVDHYM
jgi:hypothetical protein